MIPSDKLTEIGAFLKPHGYKGEIEAVADYDEIPFQSLSHIFVEMDGLMVPFRITGCRPKRDNNLLTIRGIDSEAGAKTLAGKGIFVEDSALPEGFGEDDEDVFYLQDMIGFEAWDGDRYLGRVTDYDDSTENVLLSITSPEGQQILVPAANELISELDETDKKVVFNLPQGFSDLN